MRISNAESDPRIQSGTTCRATPTTAKGKIASVVQWADRQSFHDIGAELGEALSLLPDAEASAIRTKRRAR